MKVTTCIAMILAAATTAAALPMPQNQNNGNDNCNAVGNQGNQNNQNNGNQNNQNQGNQNNNNQNQNQNQGNQGNNQNQGNQGNNQNQGNEGNNQNNGNDNAGNGNDNNAGGAGGAADFGTCTPTINFQLGRPGRDADQGTFLPDDPAILNGQSDALAPGIIMNRVCDQLDSQTCGANQAAIDQCLAAKAQVEADGSRDAGTADLFNSLVQ